MSHLHHRLPGGNDSDILLAAIEGGHRFTFATADPAHYREQPAIAALLERAEAVLAMPTDGAQWTSRLLGVHEADPFDAVLCLQDLRLVESAEAPGRWGSRMCLPMWPGCRDKAAVRERLAGQDWRSRRRSNGSSRARMPGHDCWRRWSGWDFRHRQADRRLWLAACLCLALKG
jgi:hypothetical protein